MFAIYLPPVTQNILCSSILITAYNVKNWSINNENDLIFFLNADIYKFWCKKKLDLFENLEIKLMKCDLSFSCSDSPLNNLTFSILQAAFPIF